MHIAQVAPLYESVPPKAYGGTERVVSYLTEALVARGHQVTLFASGDSSTSARLVPGAQQALRTDPTVHDPIASHMLMLEQVVKARQRFDIIHFHCDYLHFPLSRAYGLRQLTTLHGRLDFPEVVRLHRAFGDMPLVSISQAQRSPIPEASWISTVHHGLPEDLYRLEERPEDYLAFLGRISPEKGLDHAIEIAGRLGMKLKIAAKIERADLDYYQEIAPKFELPHVEYVGEIGQAQKGRFLGRARGLLFPIEWSEPFGLVLIEALACGTPVLAFRRGSVSEIIDDGETGFIVESVDQAVESAPRLFKLSRALCRRRFEERFTVKRMARDYLAAYARVLSGSDRLADVARGG
jgi:glycosyltransferase involved in cell wall biosynthesis